MNTLYLLIIAPLAQLYGIAYEICLSLTHNYGLALLCLSVLVTLIFIPLKRITMGMQNREKRLQEIMRPQIDKIKAESTGAERHHRITGLYRRYAYNPLYALRSSVGLMLQMPFLIGAYVMLSHYDPIQGHPFFLIRDLGRPDALLGGLNLLPFVMTGVNLVALYTTPSFTRRERIQGLAIAALFLVLLYSSPSALLVYWTANNVFMVLQNLLERSRRFAGIKCGEFLSARFRELPRQSVRAVLITIALIPIAIALGALLLKEGTLPESISHENPAYIFPAVIVTIVVFFAATFFITMNGYQLWFFIPWGISALFYLRSEGFVTIMPWDLQAFLCTLLVIPALLVLWHRFRPNRAEISFSELRRAAEAVFGDRGKTVYVVCVVTVGILWFLFCPTALYSSAPKSFEFPLDALFPYLGSWFVCWCLLAYLLWAVCPAFLRAFLPFLTALVSVILLANALVVLVNFGIIDGNQLGRRTAVSGWHFELDLLTFVAAVALLVVQQRFNATRLFIFGMVSLAMGLAASAFLMTYDPVNAAGRSQGELEALIQANPEGRFIAFSDEGTNSLLIVLDQFDSIGFEEHLERDPDLLERFAGFIWYPDTVAAGNCTLLSIPAMLGGYEYIPSAINRDRSRTRYDKVSEGIASLPNDFTRAGYDAVLMGGLVSGADIFSWVRRKLTHPESVHLARKFPPSLVAEWADRIGCPELAATDENDEVNLLLTIATFRVSHYWLKPRIYSDGKWMPDVQKWGMYKTLRESAMIGLLPDLSRVRSGRPTLTVLHSEVSHQEWYLPKESIVPVPNPGGENDPAIFLNQLSIRRRKQMYSEFHALTWLADFFDWMRENGVYDNTLIVVASDHNAFNFSGMGFFPPDDDRIRPGLAGSLRPSCLFMVKYPEQRGALATSLEPMTNTDTAAILRVALDGPPWTPPAMDQKRVRSHFMGHWGWASHPDNYYTGGEMLIHGNILDETGYEWNTNQNQ